MLGLTTQKTLDAVTADRDSALAELRQERDRADAATLDAKALREQLATNKRVADATLEVVRRERDAALVAADAGKSAAAEEILATTATLARERDAHAAKVADLLARLQAAQEERDRAVEQRDAEIAAARGLSAELTTLSDALVTSREGAVAMQRTVAALESQVRTLEDTVRTRAREHEENAARVRLAHDAEIRKLTAALAGHKGGA